MVDINRSQRPGQNRSPDDRSYPQSSLRSGWKFEDCNSELATEHKTNRDSKKIPSQTIVITDEYVTYFLLPKEAIAASGGEA